MEKTKKKGRPIAQKMIVSLVAVLLRALSS